MRVKLWNSINVSCSPMGSFFNAGFFEPGFLLVLIIFNSELSDVAEIFKFPNTQE
jgi:hypothetical protein